MYMESDLKQKIENFHLDWDRITEIYQKDAREKTKNECKTLEDWKNYLEKSRDYWFSEGELWNHNFYFSLSEIAEKHLKLLDPLEKTL